MAKHATEMRREHFEEVAGLLNVLADATRLEILYCLKSGPAFVLDIVERLGFKQPNVSKHLSVLYDAGLVARQRSGNQIGYSIADPLVFDLCELVCGKLQRDAEQHARLMRKMAGAH